MEGWRGVFFLSARHKNAGGKFRDGIPFFSFLFFFFFLFDNTYGIRVHAAQASTRALRSLLTTD